MKHPVPSITATMEEMPERHTWAGQTMVSLDILCISIDLRVYFLCPVIIQFHPLTPQWRGYQKGTCEASSSIHYRHNGGDARKVHVKHPVPSITATMEEMPERHTWAGQTMVSLDILCIFIDLRVYFLCPVIIQFHPLPPQWRGYQKGTCEASSSIHYCHNGGDAKKAHVKHPVPSITATMEEMPERHTLAGQTMVRQDILCVSIDLRVYFLCLVIIQFHPLPPQWRDTRKAHVKHPVPSITATMEEMPERCT